MNLEGPGPIERRLWSRLHFKVFGRWPRAVVDERLGEGMVRAHLRAQRTLDPIFKEIWSRPDDVDGQKARSDDQP